MTDHPLPASRDLAPLDFDTCEALGFDGTGRTGPAYHGATEYPVRAVRLADGYWLVGVLVTEDGWKEAHGC